MITLFFVFCFLFFVVVGCALYQCSYTRTFFLLESVCCCIFIIVILHINSHSYIIHIYVLILTYYIDFFFVCVITTHNIYLFLNMATYM